VRSNQSARLAWKISGIVDQVNVKVGDKVSAGQALASIAPASVTQNVLLAQASLTDAKKALDDLVNSNLQQAQALKALQDAQKALDDLKNSGMNRAKAEEAVANAQKSVDQANLQVYTLTHPPSQAVLDQAHANLLLAENKLQKDQKQIDRLEALMKKLPLFFRPRLRKALRGLNMGLIQDQKKYQHELDQYNRLQQPADPNEVAVAQANLVQAKAQLADAQRNLDRVKNGPSPSELAVAEAKLADAQRNWEQVKNGPNPEDVAAAQARVDAAEAALSQMNLSAPFDAVVTQLFSQPGDPVTPGTLALRLDDLTRRLVDAQVSEVDINQVKIGQPVSMTFDAIQGKEYHGKVIEVAPVGQSVQGVVNFPVTIEISDADQQVKPGMTAAVQILVSQ
jgi:HlyD family secretion protein